VAKPSWGKKLKCQSCGAVYYDMTVEKPACPKCATTYIPAVKGRRATPIPAAAPKKPAALVMDDDENSASEALVIDGDDDLDETLEDEDEDEGLIEDTSDLDDDDDDMAEIKEHVEVDLDS
jgi:predicted  nucleic acid-binding Zn-ribbon protein